MYHGEESDPIQSDPDFIDEEDRLMLEKMSKEREKEKNGAIYYLEDLLPKYKDQIPQYKEHIPMNLSRTSIRNKTKGQMCKELMIALWPLVSEAERQQVRNAEQKINKKKEKNKSSKRDKTVVHRTEEQTTLEQILQHLTPPLNDEKQIQCPQIVLRCMDVIQSSTEGKQLLVRFVDRWAYVLDIRFKALNPYGAEVLVAFPSSKTNLERYPTKWTSPDEEKEKSKKANDQIKNRNVVMDVFSITRVSSQLHYLQGVQESYMKIKCIFRYNPENPTISTKDTFLRYNGSYNDEHDNIFVIDQDHLETILDDFPNLIDRPIRRKSIKVNNYNITGKKRRDCDHGFHRLFPDVLRDLGIGISSIANYRRKRTYYTTADAPPSKSIQRLPLNKHAIDLFRDTVRTSDTNPHSPATIVRGDSTKERNCTINDDDSSDL